MFEEFYNEKMQHHFYSKIKTTFFDGGHVFISFATKFLKYEQV